MATEINISKIESALMGVAVGDALGVPVEFKSREEIRQNPVTDMIGYGTYNLPPGTWSDDSSMTFCLAEVLTEDFDLNRIGNNFVKWLYNGYWTARGDVFDVGITSRHAIDMFIRLGDAEISGDSSEEANGNGSLMRILPLLFYVLDRPIEQRYEIVRKVSAITHSHIRSVISCFYYIEFAIQIIKGKNKTDIYKYLQTEVPYFLANTISINPSEINLFDRLLKGNIWELAENDIQSTGYVLHTLEASIWAILTTNSYREATLKAVNLGNDTDTTAAVTGGLATLIYGYESIPRDWIEQIARKEDILNLAKRMSEKLIGK